MDTELLTQILALLTGAWTVYQELRHRKDKKKVTSKEMFPTRGRK